MAPRPHILKDLTIGEVSSVDRGAGEGVRVVLMKRDTSGAQPVIDFNAIKKAFGKTKTADAAEIAKAVQAAQDCIAEIEKDESIVDKAAATAEVLKQLNDHLAGLGAAMEQTMPITAEVQKEITEAVTKAVGEANKASAAQIAKLEADLAFEKLSPDEKTFCKDMSEDDKKKFASKSGEDRKKEMDDCAKRSQVDPVVKKLQDDKDALAKRLADLEEKDELVVYGKRAVACGMKEDQGAVLRKAFMGDVDAQVTLLKHVQDLVKARDEALKLAKAFDEVGGAGGGGAETGSALAQLQKKADDLRATEAGSKLTPAQAFDKVLTDPANHELAKQEKAERLAKIQRMPS